ncbi:hypothetical protein [Nostoc favosum]|uniref:Secreted protein n=1 Tax=Nostoc favosum CHAB5714 TaxID=2780399 RepID=A0ABS8IDB5_9NOSO|nr:hypothetical protein [Nostoc favosum]MCC5602215.1 hypothetical protein [Nostoc favosum CHAB5714]
MRSQNAKKIILFVIFLCSVLYAPQTLAATRQQLDNLTLDEVLALYEHELNNANIVLESCYQGAASYPIMRSSCDIQKTQWENYFAQFRLYIQQRRLIEEGN